MLHPRLTPVGATIGGTSSRFLAEIGTYGAWSDLQLTTRWGDGASGNYELSWQMNLPPGFVSPVLRRGVVVEAMNGAYRVGSPFIMSEPAKGETADDLWTITCTGVGRDVEGENSWFCDDGSGNATTNPTTAITSAISNGLRWTTIDTSVPNAAFGGTSTSDELQTIGSLMNAEGDSLSKRWLVDNTNTVRFASDPTTATYQIAPQSVTLGTADDNYATVVKVRYLDSTTSAYTTVKSPASASSVEQTFARREYATNLIGMGPISAATAQGIADGILAKAKGRLAYTNSLTVTSNQILTRDGVPASLLKVAEDVSNGCMVRLQGISSDLMNYNGQTWLDTVIGQAQLIDGDQAIQLDPLGLAPRNLAAIVEDVSGYGEAA